MTKLERLLNLIAALIHTVVPLTAEEIREASRGLRRHQRAHRSGARSSATRTNCARWASPSRSSFVPGTDPPLTGYRIDGREYAGAVPELTPDELATLHLAVQPRAGAGPADRRRVLEVRRRARRPRLGASRSSALPTDAGVGPLFRAVSERRLTRFRYNGQDRVARAATTAASIAATGTSPASTADARTSASFASIASTVEITIGRARRVRAEARHAVRPTRARVGARRRRSDRGAHPRRRRPSALGHHITWAPTPSSRPAPDGAVVLALTVRNRDAFRIVRVVVSRTCRSARTTRAARRHRRRGCRRWRHERSLFGRRSVDPPAGGHPVGRAATAARRSTRSPTNSRIPRAISSATSPTSCNTSAFRPTRPTR